MDGDALLRTDRHPSETYEDVLNRDTRPPPKHLREGFVPNLGLEGVPVDRYYSREFFQKEIDHVWSRVWQMACRTEEIVKVGDYQIYENVGRSLIVTRTAPDKIQAFYNSCLHRGRKLVTLPGHREEFRCPYHGIAWNTDGSFKDNPIAWDFPQWRDCQPRLPEARVDTWGGFVFVNFDQNARPLADIIAPLAEHFERYEFDKRYKAMHVVKVIPCNWKAAAEAFMESHHSLATHPQILPFLADVNSQYDLLSDYVSRHFSATGVPSPFLEPGSVSENDVLRAMRMTGGSHVSGGKSEDLARQLPADAVNEVPEGVTARAFAAEQTRQGLSMEDGHDYSQAPDAEMLDALLYNLWPNLSVWAGQAPNLVYRWRPNGLDPDSAIMDVMMLKRIPKSGVAPRPAPPHRLEDGEPWSNATEMGALAAIFEQDMGNLPYVQEGLKASGIGVVHFSNYTEMRIRQLHRMIDRYIAAPIGVQPDM